MAILSLREQNTLKSKWIQAGIFNKYITRSQHLLEVILHLADRIGFAIILSYSLKFELHDNSKIFLFSKHQFANLNQILPKNCNLKKPLILWKRRQQSFLCPHVPVATLMNQEKLNNFLDNIILSSFWAGNVWDNTNFSTMKDYLLIFTG